LYFLLINGLLKSQLAVDDKKKKKKKCSERVSLHSD